MEKNVHKTSLCSLEKHVNFEPIPVIRMKRKMWTHLKIYSKSYTKIDLFIYSDCSNKRELYHDLSKAVFMPNVICVAEVDSFNVRSQMQAMACNLSIGCCGLAATDFV